MGAYAKTPETRGITMERLIAARLRTDWSPSKLETNSGRRAPTTVDREIIGIRPSTTVWSAGHDVEELPLSNRDPLGWDDPLRRLVRAIEETPMPVIAMIEGSVWGGACEVAMACDIVVACDTSTFAITPAKLGVPYNLTGLMTFMNAVHLHIVKEMAFTAQPIAARRAEQLGIVNRVVPAEELEATSYGLAAHIAQNAPLSIAVMKEELNLLANARDLSPQEVILCGALPLQLLKNDLFPCLGFWAELAGNPACDAATAQHRPHLSLKTGSTTC
ncbi:methylmalonyl-CoA decarboxylase [Methylolobus aquaticus]|nr:methylmalonyl-CoA decarboxylase [Methylolobus aquaticus]